MYFIKFLVPLVSVAMGAGNFDNDVFLFHNQARTNPQSLIPILEK